ncbi:MAG: ABC transporter ATP-binding protein [Bauldia sp.]
MNAPLRPPVAPAALPAGALAAEKLAIGHGRTVIAAGIDVAVARGEVLCLIGPNGSGKTTLFRTLLGLLPALSGTVTLEGRPLGAFGRAGLARRVAHVPQAETSAFAYTVLDLVLMGRTVHLGLFATPRPADMDAALAALETLGIADLAGRDAALISGGQRQLMLIARALAQDAGILVLDEPTASLDLGNRVRVLAEIRRLADRGIAVILSTHEPEQALAIADTAAILAGGRLAACGRAAEIVTTEALTAAYGTPVSVEHTAGGRLVVVPELPPRGASGTRSKPEGSP